MAGSTIEGRRPRWAGPEVCPFCGVELEDGGPAFVEHVDADPSCRAAFDRWRDRVTEDIRGGWIG